MNLLTRLLVYGGLAFGAVLILSALLVAMAPYIAGAILVSLVVWKYCPRDKPEEESSGKELTIIQPRE